MKVGELVKINDLNEPDPKRIIGTVLKNDVYDRLINGSSEKICEVLWNDGHVSWILTSRLDLVSSINKTRK